jgi:hypothetical protein
MVLHLHRGTCVMLGAAVADAAGQLTFAASADYYTLVLENPSDESVAHTFRIDYMQQQ